MKAEGTTPAHTSNEEQAARWVRGMFGRVAPRYDLLNHLLSFQLDRYWRARTAGRLRTVLARPGVQVLDLCCGTGDLLLALQARTASRVIGCDFSRPMLDAARRKIQGASLFEADALSLPLRDASLDLITAAFGFRNFSSYRKGLAELGRVLRYGGTLAILEFSTPPNRAFAALYRSYSKHVLPRLGGAISGAPDAYSYLPESVAKFPGAEDLAEEMRRAGFAEVGFERMTGGVVALHVGRRG